MRVSTSDEQSKPNILLALHNNFTDKPQFVNAGLHKITEILNDQTHAHDLQWSLTKGGDVLRLLTNVTQPSRKDETSAYQVEQWVQDKLLHALHDRFTSVLGIMSDVTQREQHDVGQQDLVQMSIFLARLLQFDLGLSGALAPDTKALSESMCDTLFQLIMVGTSPA